MKKLLLILALIVGGYGYLSIQQGSVPGTFSPAESEIPAVTQPSGSADKTLADAFTNHRSNFQVSGEGRVTRLLADDNDGSRHQRFILSLGSGQTLLVAHNIDLAPRISSLREGDRVQFYGEYEWNDQGGVIHWTHRDPGGSHVAGWLKHNGRTYQ